MNATLSLLIGLLPLAAADTGRTPAANPVYAFVDVTVIPMDRERVLEHQTVIVRDGRIEAMGPADRTSVPSGAARVDGHGRFLMPGLAEMHAHVPSDPDYAREVLFLYMAHGITTIRGMLGHPNHLTLRAQVNAGEILGPRLWTSGPSVNGRSVPTPDVARRVAREQGAAGYDFIKIHPGLTRETFDALDRTADDVGIRFAGHVPTDVGIWRALEAGYWSIDHLDGYMDVLVADGATLPETGGWFGANYAPYVDDAKIGRLARATRDAGVWNVPTQTLMENYASARDLERLKRRPELKYMPAATRAQWTAWTERADSTGPGVAVRRRFIEIRRRLIRALHEEGAGLVLGSDAPQVWNVPGASAHRELKAIVAAGLTPYEALETGTRNVAEFFGVLDRTGTVQAGKWADLILLEANPLTDIANSARLAGVMVRGHWMPRSEIDTRLSEIAARYTAGDGAR